jgi:uncharacterized protein (UPF0261 family)
MPRILVAGTADTKGEELAFLVQLVRDAGGTPILVDLGIGSPRIPVDVSNSAVARLYSEALDRLGSKDRGPAITAMGKAFSAYCASQSGFDAAIGIGGGGGTSMISEGFRAFPIGFPKLIVSTMASGNVAPYVDINDIGMIYSVTDFAGLNRLSRTILRNAAFAIVGMARAGKGEPDSKPAIGLSMFGVTTPCVTALVDRLKDNQDCLVFHATGSGGRAMEKLVDSGLIERLIDVTTTEIADEVCGGALSAGPDRLGSVARTKIPYIGSVGACDMVNFGEPETVPTKFKGRLFYHHNPQVTLMRTSSDDCSAIGQFIGDKLNACLGPVHILIPEGGISMLDAPGQPFHNPQANSALFDAIERTLKPKANTIFERLPLHINAPEFAQSLARAFQNQMK